MTTEPVIIGGNSHPELTRRISYLTKIKQIPTDVIYFANKEIKPIIKSTIRKKDVYIIQTGLSDTERSINDHLMETFLLISTCKRSDVNTITLIMPFYPYARQDKKDKPRGAISARDIANLLETSGIDRIVCMDLHCAQIQGFFKVPCDNLYGFVVLSKRLKQLLNNDDDEYVIISPDEGAIKRAKEYASLFNLPFLVLSKERDYSKKNIVSKTSLIGDKKYLDNRIAIIVDDMADTFGTVQKTSDILVEKGARWVIVVITHGVLSGPAIDRINNCNSIKLVLTTDTLPQDNHMKKSSKIETVSIASLLGEYISRLCEGRSVSEIFDTFKL